MRDSKKITKVALIIIVVGLFLAIVGSIGFGFNFKKLESGNFVTNTYEVRESFSSIVLTDDLPDVDFVFSENGECKVVCVEFEKKPHSVIVEGDKLIIKKASKDKWFENIHIGVVVTSPKITVYLPRKDYDTLKVTLDTGDVEIEDEFSFNKADIETSTGDVTITSAKINDLLVQVDTGHINLENISSNMLDLTADTGDIKMKEIRDNQKIKFITATGHVKLEDILCNQIQGTTDTGDIKFKNVIVAGEIKCISDTGSIHFDKSDAEALSLRTDTGDVKGTLLTDKVYVVKTDTGDIDVPYAFSGGKCEIETDTGDIKIKLSKK